MAAPNNDPTAELITVFAEIVDIAETLFLRWFPIISEDFGHIAAKQLRHTQCERQTWVILVGLNGVDGLPRHAKQASEVTLRQAFGLTNLSELVFQVTCSVV